MTEELPARLYKWTCAKCGRMQEFSIRPNGNSTFDAYDAGLRAEAQAFSYGWFYKDGKTYCQYDEEDV